MTYHQRCTLMVAGVVLVVSPARDPHDPPPNMGPGSPLLPEMGDLMASVSGPLHVSLTPRYDSITTPSPIGAATGVAIHTRRFEGRRFGPGGETAEVLWLSCSVATSVPYAFDARRVLDGTLPPPVVLRLCASSSAPEGGGDGSLVGAVDVPLPFALFRNSNHVNHWNLNLDQAAPLEGWMRELVQPGGLLPIRAQQTTLMDRTLMDVIFWVRVDDRCASVPPIKRRPSSLSCHSLTARDVSRGVVRVAAQAAHVVTHRAMAVVDRVRAAFLRPAGARRSLSSSSVPVEGSPCSSTTHATDRMDHNCDRNEHEDPMKPRDHDRLCEAVCRRLQSQYELGQSQWTTTADAVHDVIKACMQQQQREEEENSVPSPEGDQQGDASTAMRRIRRAPRLLVLTTTGDAEALAQEQDVERGNGVTAACGVILGGASVLVASVSTGDANACGAVAQRTLTTDRLSRFLRDWAVVADGLRDASVVAIGDDSLLSLVLRASAQASASLRRDHRLRRRDALPVMLLSSPSFGVSPHLGDGVMEGGGFEDVIRAVSPSLMVPPRPTSMTAAVRRAMEWSASRGTARLPTKGSTTSPHFPIGVAVLRVSADGLDGSTWEDVRVEFVKCIHIVCTAGMDVSFAPCGREDGDSESSDGIESKTSKKSKDRLYGAGGGFVESASQPHSVSSAACSEVVSRPPVLVGAYRFPCQGHFEFSTRQQLPIPSFGEDAAAVAPLRVWTTRDRSEGLKREPAVPKRWCSSLYGVSASVVECAVAGSRNRQPSTPTERKDVLSSPFGTTTKSSWLRVIVDADHMPEVLQPTKHTGGFCVPGFITRVTVSAVASCNPTQPPTLPLSSSSLTESSCGDILAAPLLQPFPGTTER